MKIIQFLLLLPHITLAFILVASSSHPHSTATQISAKQQATFSMGCFWEPAEELLNVPGVTRTIAGYTGNSQATTKPPNYDKVCFSRDWAEAVRVEYDDTQLSYEDLLYAFWEVQKPKLGSRQYASIIFPHSVDQETAAKEFLNVKARPRTDGWMPSWTTVEPLSKFYQAEGYHQDYWKKQRPRFAAIVGLIAVATGILDPIVPEAYQQTLITGANSATIALGVYIAAERWFDAKVVEL